MKNLKQLFLLANLLIATLIFAQAPEKFSYQAVVRNASNTLVANQNVGMRISILQGSAAGTAVYVETHTAATNANGLVTVQIGGGTVTSGTFASIDWSNGPYFIKTETDPAGGSSYSITGTTQLLSVPNALNSKNGIPKGGAANQVLAKVNATDFNTQWVTPSSGGSSSYKGIVLDVAHTLSGMNVTTGVNAANYSRELTFKSSDVITAPPSSVGTFTAYCPHVACGTLESGKNFNILTNGPSASSFSNHAFTAIEPGYYQINCEVVGIGATSANPQLQPIIVVNSPGAVFKQVVYGTVNSNGNTFSNNTRSRGMVSAVVKLNADDYVGTVVFNLSNAATGTLSSDGTTRMTIVKL